MSRYETKNQKTKSCKNSSGFVKIKKKLNRITHLDLQIIMISIPWYYFVLKREKQTKMCSQQATQPLNTPFCNVCSEASAIFSCPSPLIYYKTFSLKTKMHKLIRKWKNNFFRNMKWEMSNSWSKNVLLLVNGITLAKHKHLVFRIFTFSKNRFFTV